MNDLIGYKKEMDYLQARTREKRTIIDDEHNKELGKIKERYNIPPKEIATYNDLVRMIAIVLETGKIGRVVIRKYAEQAEKTEKWRKEIAKYRAKNGFKLALLDTLNCVGFRPTMRPAPLETCPPRPQITPSRGYHGPLPPTYSPASPVTGLRLRFVLALRLVAYLPYPFFLKCDSNKL